MRPTTRRRPLGSRRPSTSERTARAAEHTADDRFRGRAGSDLDPRPAPGQVSVVSALGNDTLDARGKMLAQPSLGQDPVIGGWGDRERHPRVGQQLNEPTATDPVRVTALVPPGGAEHVKHDQARRRLTRTRPAQAALQLPEVAPPADRDHQLPVQHDGTVELLGDRGGNVRELAGEVAAAVPTVLRSSGTAAEGTEPKMLAPAGATTGIGAGSLQDQHGQRSSSGRPRARDRRPPSTVSAAQPVPPVLHRPVLPRRASVRVRARFPAQRREPVGALPGRAVTAGSGGTRSHQTRVNCPA